LPHVLRLVGNGGPHRILEYHIPSSLLRVLMRPSPHPADLTWGTFLTLHTQVMENFNIPSFDSTNNHRDLLHTSRRRSMKQEVASMNPSVARHTQDMPAPLEEIILCSPGHDKCRGPIRDK
jgi:hypothetical protein